MKNNKILNVFIFVLYFLMIIMGYAAIRLLPDLVDFSKTTYSEIAYLARPVTVMVLIAGIPFFIVLIETVKLCKYILNNEIFTQYPLRSLNRISFSSLIIGGIFISIMILFLINNYFTPLLAVILFLVILSSFIISIIGKIFSIMIQVATVIKLDNDLTI